MDVILLQDVDKVGLRGEVVSVSRGYMRNYLKPRKLAEEATEALVAELERRDAERARHEARSAEEAETIAETLRKTVLSFDVNAGPQGTLFGSVTSTDIVDEIWRTRKIRVDRRKVELGDPIKRIGRYAVPITVFEGVQVEVKTLVVPIGGELPPEEELEAMAAAEAEAAAAAEAEAAEAHAEAEAAIAEVEAEEAEAEAEETEEAAEEAEEAEAEAEPEIEPAAEAEAPAADVPSAQDEDESSPA
jgi:large subunit ribosomal protein L9